MDRGRKPAGPGRLEAPIVSASVLDNHTGATTEIYAEADLLKAAQAMGTLG